MNLENEIINEASKRFANSIDRHIMASMLVENGYFEVVVDPWVHGSANDIDNWCDANCENNWFNEGNRWLFESNKDAIIFRLKWG